MQVVNTFDRDNLNEICSTENRFSMNKEHGKTVIMTYELLGFRQYGSHNFIGGSMPLLW